MLARTISFASILLAATTAFADDAVPQLADATVAEPAPPPPGLTLPAGKLAVQIDVQSNMTADAMGDSISLAPDLAFGITDAVTVALVHTVNNSTGFWSGLSTGSVCVAGEQCGDVYSTGALLSKIAVVNTARVALAGLGGVVYNVDPFRLGLGAGAEALVRFGKLGLHVKPTIYIGLNERDNVMGPNREFVNAPVSLLVAPRAGMQMGVQSGIAGPVDGFGDAYRVPVAVMASHAILPNLTGGLAFSLDRVTGGAPAGAMTPGALDTRSLTLSVVWVK
jgi:hypothetical protein